MTFEAFFSTATGIQTGPYHYQKRLAEKIWPDLLDVPTGMGKTAAVALAWVYRRRVLQQEDMPRRLVWCLPMRVLVEQTRDNIRSWLDELALLGDPGQGRVSVHVLMGGQPELRAAQWAQHPEEDAVLIGTQDMLLSRALMRGYGMSRYQWPVHFSLLHNDSLWVFDEVQLMGAGLATSTQLEAFRRCFSLARNSRSLWVSATLNPAWLGTVDLAPHLGGLVGHRLSDADRHRADTRLAAVKSLDRAGFSLTSASSNRAGREAYLKALCDCVLSAHEPGTQTLVIVNRVQRAQGLFRLLCQRRPDADDLLIHARFRAAEREQQGRRLRDSSNVDRVIVATQAIEAGVDMSSRQLVTELAPWASMVQRFGRCNRYGEHNSEGARVLWVDIENDADVLPYSCDELAEARDRLDGLDSANPASLPAIDDERPLSPVLRRKDLLELFNTDPDLSGFDVDISGYIRDTGTPGVQVFWRQFDDPNLPQPQGRAERAELCPVSIGQFRDFVKAQKVDAWYRDALDDQWVRLDRSPRPGMTLLLKNTEGGYDERLGFDAGHRKPPVPVIVSDEGQAQDANHGGFGGDWRSRQPTPVALPDHLAHVAGHARDLCHVLGETAHAAAVIRAGRWHDLGKLHEVFQNSMYRCKDTTGEPLAKSDCPGPMRHGRPFFRHELVSMLAWLDQNGGDGDADLVAYLIAAHHGKVRLSLRAMPAEEAHPDVPRFARGVWEGDVLPALSFDGEHSRATTLDLELMELGEGKQGRSWAARTLELLDNFGPFYLAWLESLVRIADWRASAEEQKQI